MDIKDVDAFIFDLDDTLFDTSEYAEIAIYHSVKSMIEAGLPCYSVLEALDKLKDIRMANSNAKDHFDKLCIMYGVEPNQRIIMAGVQAYHNTKVSLISPIVGVKQVLSYLFWNGVKLGIISNGHLNKQWDKIHRLGISEYFYVRDSKGNVCGDNVFVSLEEGVRKPSVVLFENACKYIDVKPERCFYVGDRIETDLVPAKKVGYKTIFYHNPKGKYSSKIKDEDLFEYDRIIDYRVKSFVDILLIFNENR
jgi:putative hydrolase of the HAD superfamily